MSITALFKLEIDFVCLQALVAAGHLDLERSFDDFRIVIGDNSL